VAVLGEIPNQQVCLTNLFRVLRPGAVLAVHEHVPDPDRIACPALRLLVESAGYRLRDCWGRAWNFTAIFERP
jgi:hypothetical protein